MRLLHISDLHLKEHSGLRTNNILSRLYDFLAANANEKHFDHIIITGDLRDTRDGASVDDTILIVNAITNAARLIDKQCVHIIPGNHDYMRRDNDSTVIGNIRKEYDPENGVFSNTTVTIPSMAERFEEYFWPLSKAYYGSLDPWQNYSKCPHTIRIHDQNAFIYLNSCITYINSDTEGSLLFGLHYLDQLLQNTKDAINVFILSHHPVQNFATREEAGLEKLINSYSGKQFYWLCGDAHSNRLSQREYIRMYQVGSLTNIKTVIPDFAIYDLKDGVVERRVFRFLSHLNSTSMKQGGWKRIYIDSKSTGLKHQ